MTMPLRHLMLALAIVAVWGSNFTIVGLALHDFPPLLFATLRFAFVFLPAALLVQRPSVPWRTVAAYGCLIFAGQFGLMFYAMGGMISAGLASLVVQSQVFFTILLAALLERQRISRPQATALLLAASGMALLMLRADGGTSPIGLILVVVAGLCWSGGNHIARSTKPGDAFGLTVWATLFATPLLAVATLLLDGPIVIGRALTGAQPLAWAAVAWQALGNTLFGYGLWAWLLSRHPAATVTPLALLVPVFGLATASVVLGEPLPPAKLVAAGLILTGLVVNIVARRRNDRLERELALGEPV